MKIVTAPQKVLSLPAQAVKKIDKGVITLIEEMKKTLNETRDPEGVGLAAPQIGKALQLFIVKPTLKSNIDVYINPHLTFPNTLNNQIVEKQHKKNESKKTQLEGCLSLPRIWGEVVRNPKVTISYLDEKGIKHKKTVSGFYAIILQHEFDHLQGVLFPKRVLEQKGQLYKSHKNEKGQDEFEEIEI